jgi:DNA (cytosine-5)-methyltransferase 1
MARLHGFPDWFRFHGTKWHGARQIGNSVPPPLARAVASQIMSAMDAEPTAPPGELALGDVSLLRMTLAQASAHWGITNPIGQRDRKNDATKPKQPTPHAEQPASLF